MVYEVPAGAGCPDELGFVDLVRARASEVRFDDDAPSTLSVAVERAPNGLRGRLEQRDASGEVIGRRELEGAECASVAEALAVAASIAFESLRELERAEPEPRTIVRLVERDPERPPALVPAEPEPGPSLGGSVHAGVGIGYGPGPLPHTSFELGGALRYDALGVGLAVRYGDSFAAGSAGAYGLRTRLLRAILGACFMPDPFEVCGTGSVGLLEGEAQGVADPTVGQALFASVGATFGATLMFDAHVGLRGRLELSLVLNRTTFALEGAPIWTGSPVLGELDVSILSRW